MVTPDSVNGVEKQVTLDYDVEARTTTLRQQVSATNLVLSRFTFDGLGRLVKTEKRQTSSSPTAPLATQRMEFDESGRVRFQSEWYNPVEGDPNVGTTFSYRDPLSDPANPADDPFGRVRKVTTADGKVTRTDYSGLSSTVTIEGITGTQGPFTAMTYYGRDAFGRLTEVLSPRQDVGMTRTGADAFYKYDVFDQLEAVRLEGSDVNGAQSSQHRSFTYDALGRQASTTYPENGTVLNRRYDPMGNLTEKEDSAGNVFTYTYDKALRMTFHKVAPGGGTPRNLVKNVYDEAGGSFGHSAGKLTTVTSYAEDLSTIMQEQRRYNGLNGRLSTRAFKIGGWDPSLASTVITAQPELTMSYTYNELGLLSKIVYPDWAGSGRTITSPMYDYSNGLLVSVDDPNRGGPLVDLIDYNPAGAIKRIVTRGGVETNITADVRNRPSSIVITGPPPPSGGGGGGGGLIQELHYSWLSSAPRIIGQGAPSIAFFQSGAYSYDGAGNISDIGNDHFKYDALNRLVTARVIGTVYSGIHDMTWSYDDFGNMLSQFTTVDNVTSRNEFVVTPTRNQISSYAVTRDAPLISEASYEPEYDSNGNMSVDRYSTRVFNARNMLWETYRKDDSDPNVYALSGKYTYDHDGYRVTKFDAFAGVTTYYVRDLNGQVLSEFRRLGTQGIPLWAKDYVYAAGRHVAMVENDIPAPPSGILPSASQGASAPFVNVDWAMNLEIDLLKYRVHKSDASGGNLVVFDVNHSTPHFHDEDVVSGVQYLYRLTAVDQAGLESDYSESVYITPGDSTGPNAPQNLLISKIGDELVKLTWSAPTMPVPDPHDLWGYYVYRKEVGSSADYEQKGGLFRIKTVTDLTPVNGQGYLYIVKAVDTAGKLSTASNAVNPIPLDLDPPDTPQGLFALPDLAFVDLAWRPSVASDVAGYRIYRSTSPIDLEDPGSYATVAQAAYHDVTSISSSTTYYYRVSAVDDDGRESELTSELLARTKDADMAPTSISGLAWNFCDQSSYNCFLSENKRQCNGFGGCWDIDTSHENLREVDLAWTPQVGSGLTLSQFKLYSRRFSDEPYELYKTLPASASFAEYPLFLWITGAAPSTWEYDDFAPDPSDACAPLDIRASAISTTGRESTLSSAGFLSPYLLAPENLRAEPEAIPRDLNGVIVPGPFFLPPEQYGVTLSWTGSNSNCGMTLGGYNVYRSRYRNGSIYGAGSYDQGVSNIPIRMNRQPIDVTHFRVEFLPLLSAQLGKGGSYAFVGPPGYYAGYSSAPRYSVTAVDVHGNESGSSNATSVHANAEQATGACKAYQACPPTSSPYNYEAHPRGGFLLPTPVEVTPPGEPGSLNWVWSYGSSHGPSARNWARVTWQVPISGSANEYTLLRQQGTDPTYHEIETSMIPGDDTGIRDFIWALPLDLACEDANYRVRAVDLFDRPTDTSATSDTIQVLKYKLIPEQPTAQASNPQVTIQWDPLEDCSHNPNFHLTGYKVLRSSAMTSCTGSMPSASTSYSEIGSVSASQWSFTYPPPDSGSAYWYRLRSVWNDSCPGYQESGMSAGVCISASGQYQNVDYKASYTLNGSQFKPDSLTVPAEAISPVDVTTPAFHGLDLTWTVPAPTCAWTPAGTHVYRSRWNGSAYGGPPIRITPLELPTSALRQRVDYLPITKGHLGAPEKDIVGPPGYRENIELPPTYRATSVNTAGEEGEFSTSGVRAHTDATYSTQASQADSSVGPMNERYYAVSFTHADPTTTLIPGTPTGLNWYWFYGKTDFSDIAPHARNWAIVKWAAPTDGGPVNDYHLLRKTAADQDFVAVDTTGFIPGDDLGVRQFIWSVPLELACEDADYKVVGVDVFGRPGAVSSTHAVAKRKLVPESLSAAVINPSNDISLSWGALPSCASNSTHHLTSYVVMRSEVHGDSDTCPAPQDATNPNLWTPVGSPVEASVTSVRISPPFPGHPARRFWYRVKALWGPSGESAMSEAICANNGGQHLGDDPPQAQLFNSTSEPTVVIAEASSWEVDAAEAGEIIRKEARSLVSEHRMIGTVPNPAVKLYFYHLDHLGTPRVITSSSGQPVSKHQYLPFGEELTPLPTNSTHKFTGHERDAETGLDYMLARHYLASLGRMLSADPGLDIAPSNPQTWNLFSYGRNNPMRYLDPTGKYVTTCADGDKRCEAEARRFEKARQKNLKSKEPKIRESAQAFGDPGVVNGVTVSFVRDEEVGEGNAGETTPGITPDLKPDIKVKVVEGQGEDALRVTVGHEGTHVAQAMRLIASVTANGDYDPTLDLTKYQKELEAYKVSSAIVGELGHWMRIGGYTFKPGASCATVSDMINELLAKSYGVTPQNQGPKFFSN